MGEVPIQVLLIEDDRDFQLLMEEAFTQPKNPPFHLECTSDLSSSLKRIAEGEIDAILLDLNLKDSKGLDTLAKIQTRAENIPIVVLTGTYDETLGTEALKQGAEDYFVKGRLDHALLIRSIRYAIERKRQEAELKGLLLSIPSILIGISPDDLVTHWNHVAERTFGIAHEKVIHKPFRQCGVGWDLRRILQGISECRRKNEAVRVDDLPFKRLDNTAGFLGLTVNPIQGNGGKGIGILIFGADITERKQLETHLRQIQKMELLATFVASITHEFKNLLSPLLGYIQLTRKELPKESKGYEHLSQALAVGERTLELVKQLLAFGRQEEEKKKPIELDQAVDEAFRLIRKLIPPEIEVVSNLERSCTIFADPNQIREALVNLWTNASYAMRKSGGKLTVGVQAVEIHDDLARFDPELKPGPYVKLTVADTGEGIRPEVMSRIFEPFFTTKPEGEGTGMGLAVVYGIVTSHDGAIDVSSKPGCGTTFDLYFPRIKSRK